MTKKPAVLIALSVLVSSSGAVHAADPLLLSCESGELNTGPKTWQATVDFRIALDTQTIELVEPDGTLLASSVGGNLGGMTAAVQIGPGSIHWSRSNNVGVVFYGTINRETGEASANWTAPLRGGELTQWFWSGRCRRAAAKF